MSHEASHGACMELTEDDVEMGRCPQGHACDCYWCPHCQEPHASFIECIEPEPIPVETPSRESGA